MNLAIIIKSNDKNIETFIQNHIDLLPFKIHVFYGTYYPYLYDGCKENKIMKLFYKAVSYLLNKQHEKLYEKRMFAKHLKKLKIDAVLAEYLNTAAKVTNQCKTLGIPLYATALGYDISVFKVLKDNKKSYKSLFEYASKIFIVSNHMKVNLAKYGCSMNKIVYSPAGPSDLFFETKPNFESYQLFSLGRFVDKKAPYLTLMSFYYALQKEPKLTMKMGGDGPLLQVCKDLSKALKIENNINFIGRINQEEQRAILQESILYIQHSKVAPNGDSEGTPVAILEASASGLPIVSTLHAGIPEVVIHNTTGLLSREGDVMEMSKNILTITNNAELAKQLGAKGKLHTKGLFSLNRHIETLAKEIRNTVTLVKN